MGHVFQDECWEDYPSGCYHYVILNIGKTKVTKDTSNRLGVQGLALLDLERDLSVFLGFEFIFSVLMCQARYKNERDLLIDFLVVCLFGWGRSYLNPFYWAMESKARW